MKCTVAPACVMKRIEEATGCVPCVREFRSTTTPPQTQMIREFLFQGKKTDENNVFNNTARKCGDTHTHTTQTITGSVTMERLSDDTPWRRLKNERNEYRIYSPQRRLEIGSSSRWMFDTWGRGGEYRGNGHLRVEYYFIFLPPPPLPPSKRNVVHLHCVNVTEKWMERTVRCCIPLGR